MTHPDPEVSVTIVRPARIPLVLAALLLAAPASALDVSLPSPAVEIRIPDLEQFPIGPHPNAPRQPAARLYGENNAGITFSVLTPTADPGTAAARCASWLAGTVLSRFAPPLDQLQILKAGDNAHVLLFPFDAGGVEQLKAFVVSGDGKGHCVEVHVSRMAPTAQQREDWFRGFRNVTVTTR